MSPSSSIIVYSGGARFAFDFLHAHPSYVAGLLFHPRSYVLGFEAVSRTPLVRFCCSLVCCVFSFFPFWVPIFFGASSIYVIFPWTILGRLGTWISGRCVSPYSACPSVVLSVTSWVMVGIFHSSDHSLMTISISPYLMQ
jgi:hypothetical protein